MLTQLAASAGSQLRPNWSSTWAPSDEGLNGGSATWSSRGALARQPWVGQSQPPEPL